MKDEHFPILADPIEIVPGEKSTVGDIAVMKSLAAHRSTLAGGASKRRDDVVDRRCRFPTAVDPGCELPVHERMTMRVNETREHCRSIDIENVGLAHHMRPAISFGPHRDDAFAADEHRGHGIIVCMRPDRRTDDQNLIQVTCHATDSFDGSEATVSARVASTQPAAPIHSTAR